VALGTGTLGHGAATQGALEHGILKQETLGTGVTKARGTLAGNRSRERRSGRMGNWKQGARGQGANLFNYMYLYLLINFNTILYMGVYTN
jgi:hypothetical protein